MRVSMVREHLGVPALKTLMLGFTVLIVFVRKYE